MVPPSPSHLLLQIVDFQIYIIYQAIILDNDQNT